MARRRPYPPELVTAVTAAMSPHAATCVRDGCPHCKTWRTRAHRALAAAVAAGALADPDAIRAAERRRCAGVLRGPAAAAAADDVVEILAAGPTASVGALLGALRLRLADLIETGGAR
ncbi:hypothetical protein ACGFI9_21800 [Micromonospora sp. NPDC048930]|uniref:hypothetical protein n=1 Tax=Micromonospora sp. NPDC048930 TaxID=3364261 RepID=UPI00371D8F63